MSERHSLEVYDKDGWCRTYPLQKPIVRIGSDSGNDVILENERGDGVASLHAQLIASTENGTAYRLINLADSEIVLNPDNGEKLPPRSAVDVTDAFTFVMGQFTLVFHTGSGAAHTEGKYATSVRQNIGLRVAVERTQLVPEEWINGVVTVSNLGDLTGVQFELDLDGFDHDCFDLEPGPLLSSGAEKEVLFRLYHRNIRPSAGQHQITIRAAAPRAYPGEAASVTQTIEVLPFYRHQVSILAQGQSDTPPEEQDLLAAIPMVVSTSRPSQQSRAVPVADSSDVWSTTDAAVPGARQAVEMKARPPRPISTEPPADSEEETEDWFTTPVESSAPPQAIPAAQEPLAAVPFGDTQAPPVSDEAAELWGGSDESSSVAPPPAQQPLPPAPAPSQTESDDEADWWGTPDETDVSPAAVAATAAAVGAVAVAAAEKDDDDNEPRPRRNQAESQMPDEPPPAPEPDLPPVPAALPPVNVAEPVPHAEATEPTIKDAAQAWLEKADAESAKARQLADEVDQAIHQQAKPDIDVDTPREDLAEVAAPAVTSAAVLPKVERSQPPDSAVTDAETLVLAQPPQPADTPAQESAVEKPVSLWNKFKQKLPFSSGSDKAAVTETPPETEKPETPLMAQESVSTEPPLQMQVEPEPDTETELTSPVSAEVEPELPQVAQPAVQAEELPAEEVAAIAQPEPAPPVQVEPEPDIVTEPETVSPVVPEVEPEPSLQVGENEWVEAEADEAEKVEVESLPSVIPADEPELPQAEAPPTQVEQMPAQEPGIPAEPEPPIFPEIEPEAPQAEEPSLQSEETKLPEEEPVQSQSKPETEPSAETAEDWFVDEAADKQDVDTAEKKPEIKDTPAVEDDWWGEDFETDEKPHRVLKLKADSTDKLTTLPPKKEKEENPEDWWNE